MSENPIEIDFDYGSSDYRRVLFWNQRRSIILGWALIGLMLVVAGLGVILALTTPSRTIKLNLLMFLFPLGFVCLIQGLRYFSIIRQSKMLGDASERTRIYFDETGIQAISASSTSQTIWEKFYRVRETKTDFILFPMKRRLVPIPKRGFTSSEDIIELRDLLSRHLGSKAKLLND